MLFQVQNDTVVCVNIKGRRLVIASLLIYLSMCVALWLFPMVYVGQLNDLRKLIEVGNLIASLLATVFIVLLGGAFLFVKIWKQLAGRKRKVIWKIIAIHIVVVATEYLMLNVWAKDAPLSALSILFQIVSVGLARALTIPNMVFKVVLVSYSNVSK